jgi:hypothetical protein
MDEWMVKYLYSYQNGVCLANQSDDNRALLHSLARIFDLKDSSLRRAADILALFLLYSKFKLRAYKVTESLS